MCCSIQADFLGVDNLTDFLTASRARSASTALDVTSGDPEGPGTNTGTSSYPLNPDTATGRAFEGLERVPSRDAGSIHSNTTVIPLFGFPTLTAQELCQFVATSDSLQSAEIISIEGYLQMIRVIPHRFLVMHLRREGHKDVWLRLDRRTDSNVGTFGLIARAGRTKANDLVGNAVFLITLRVSEAFYSFRRSFLHTKKHY